jgi:predicted enzyme related to lactoylglutathione lyase
MSKFEGNATTWFEIPTTNMDRAVEFYETILDIKLQEWPGDEPYFIFPAAEGEVAGALVQRPGHQPSSNGAMIFLNVDGKLDAVLLPRTEIPGANAFYACVLDSEGNHIGLHSR